MRKPALISLFLIALSACKGADADGDGIASELDCDDHDATVGGPFPWYGDLDADGYAGEVRVIQSCWGPEGFVAEATDCDDLSAAINPSAQEICDEVDNDCDGDVDDGDASVDPATYQTFYQDQDADGYGTSAQTTTACAPPAGYAAADGDCDDQDADLSPETPWYVDLDGDGWGVADQIYESCTQPSATSALAGDCDDLDKNISPDAQEECDGEDNDCDGLVDDADDSVDPAGFSTYIVDADLDGYGVTGGATVEACDPPTGYAALEGDCLDTEPTVNPGETERCNDGLDNDCSGDSPECGLHDGVLTDAPVLLSGTSGSHFSYAARMVDLNQDGALDLLIGGYYSAGGYTYLEYGPITADWSASTEADATFSGTLTSDYSGKALDAGDLDGDGYAELAIGAYGEDTAAVSAGALYLVYGSATAFSGTYDLSTNAQMIALGANASDYVGSAVSFPGDLDGDGRTELAVGAFGTDPNGSLSGSVYLWYGSSERLAGTDDISTLADAQIMGRTSGSDLGYYRGIAGPVDVDGDGLGELWLGAYGDKAETTSGGAAYLFLGGSGPIEGAFSCEDADWQLTGGSSGGYLGSTVVGLGDLDGDGYEELGVGAYGVSTVVSEGGAAYVISGSASGWSGSLTASAAAATTIDGTGATDHFGLAMAAGDLDGDGERDLVVGANGAEVGSTEEAGAAFLFYGPLSGGSLTAGDADVRVDGTATNEYAGTELVVGDLSGDGISDLLLGAHGKSRAGLFLGGDE